MAHGDRMFGDGEIELNAGDRAVPIGSHFHFFEVDRAMSFGRDKSFGMRLDIAAGAAVRRAVRPEMRPGAGGRHRRRGGAGARAPGGARAVRGDGPVILTDCLTGTGIPDVADFVLGRREATCSPAG
ncbi:urease subunit beta [Actinomadura nitritigenes]|uniref:urease subunit beta n=1 Tax=Actinomadura nitritigenes TaxID=134602 RepID=UPI003D930DB4